jgi:hypothetical protein
VTVVRRIRVTARSGIATYAGPSSRQLLVARGLPLLAPLAFKILAVAGLHFSPLYYFLTSLALFQSARTFRDTGIGLGILTLVQLVAAFLATVLLGIYVLSSESWLRLTGTTFLMMGYVSFLFNLIGSYLPR